VHAATTLPVRAETSEPGSSTSSQAAPARRRRRHPIRWAAFAAGLGSLLVDVLFALSRPTTAFEAQSPLLGKRAPPILGPTLVGRSFSLASLRGHFIIVDFFASWCVACQREQPQLDRFVVEHRGPSAPVLVGVVFNDSISDVRQFLGPELWRYPVVADKGGQIANAYGVDNPPEKYLVSPSGIVIDKVVGPVTAAFLDRLIAKAKSSGW
jgi:cytochrome c biogenesis protein CcmG/thiol:disulfide interchange protein DsbE